MVIKNKYSTPRHTTIEDSDKGTLDDLHAIQLKKSYWYGTMRDNVINLKAVLEDGEVVKTASRARKRADGYDLTRLMIGSECTLGVITEVTLRLQKIPQHLIVAMCNFPTVKDAADVAIAAMLSGIQVSRVDLLDEVQVKAVNLANGKDLP